MTEGHAHSKVVIALLAISVSINLLVAGMVVGQRLDGSRPLTRIEAARDPNAGRPGPYDLFVKSAPDPVLPFLKEAIASHQDLSQVQLQQLREARREATRQLKALPFDAAATSAAFARVRALFGEIQRGVHETAIGAYARAYGQTPPPSDPQQ